MIGLNRPWDWEIDSGIDWGAGNHHKFKRIAAAIGPLLIEYRVLFVDYAGQHPHLVDARTGEQIDVELFVAVLGASNYTYAEASLTQRLPAG